MFRVRVVDTASGSAEVLTVAEAAPLLATVEASRVVSTVDAAGQKPASGSWLSWMFSRKPAAAPAPSPAAAARAGATAAAGADKDVLPAVAGTPAPKTRAAAGPDTTTGGGGAAATPAVLPAGTAVSPIAARTPAPSAAPPTPLTGGTDAGSESDGGDYNHSRYVKSLFPTSEELQRMNLKWGVNDISFVVGGHGLKVRTRP